MGEGMRIRGLIILFDPGRVMLDVYNAVGQKVARLLEKDVKNIGEHEISWKPGNLPSGACFLVMSFNNYQQVRRISYIR